jgi:23S rRNA pseudouridine2605 synthase
MKKEREHKKNNNEQKPFNKFFKKNKEEKSNYNPLKKKFFRKHEDENSEKNETKSGKFKRDFNLQGKDFKKPFKKKSFHGNTPFEKPESVSDGKIRLNKYISNAGICSRREADQYISSGVVKVNGKVITELGYKINQGDEVQFDGQSLKQERKVYLLLNKPKDYITTADDPEGRKTVLDLIKGACKERVYPVGRLDRNTSGLLLLTNDGDLTKRLTHPRFGIKKIYHVTLDKNINPEHLDQLVDGIELEDGRSHFDSIYYLGQAYTKNQIVVELHSGKNKIVRRMFEHLGYDVKGLDRTQFAGLTKKELPRGRWRYLNEKEVGMLKMTQAQPKNSI